MELIVSPRTYVLAKFLLCVAFVPVFFLYETRTVHSLLILYVMWVIAAGGITATYPYLIRFRRYE